MALSKIDAELTAITTVPSEGGAVTTNIVQGLAKAWYRLDNDYTGQDPNSGQTNGLTVQDSLNVTSIQDNGTGDFSMAWVNAFDNALYAITQQGQYRDDVTIYERGFMAGIKGSPTSANYTFLWRYSDNGAFDPAKWWAVSQGDLA